ncbi:hypothetical protein [Dyadobacter sp. NIV53]|uniref:hypothetical protein n=1 Tax=Dyadobacter sp. NIV53 TaxID=2861765 RepID=UPI001C88C7DB|nr:hypothetical protein [Dyadobacter sp. NIV53]
MTSTTEETNKNWNWYEKLAFRFFFILLIMHAEPWGWPASLPVVGDYLGLIIQPYYDFFDWLTGLVKKHILHTDLIITPNGSGDTIDSWIIYSLIFVISLAGTIIWTLTDRRNKRYDLLNTWLQVIIRYYLAKTMFVYGLIKLFPLQMPSPSLSQLITPLGEYSRMRLAWLFIGSSSSYQIFSGFCELLGGLLLLSRRTSSLGALILVTVLTHVVALNVFFDIPVKLYSSILLVMSIYLLVPNIRQFWSFFILHIPVQLTFPGLNLKKKWKRVTRIALKTIFIAAFLMWPFYENMNTYSKGNLVWGAEKGVISGYFNVEEFRVNGRNVMRTAADTFRWENLVFEDWNAGSIKSGVSQGTSLRYGRDYFDYKADTIQNVLQIKFRKDSVRNFKLTYTLPDPDHLILSGRRGNDSLYVFLKKKNTGHFLLNNPLNWVQNSVP